VIVDPVSALARDQIFAGKWRIVRCIRSGGMGAVYEVVHGETTARCALKVMLPDLVDSAELQARFRQEAIVTAKIQSDHIVKVFDAGTDAETRRPFLVMELLDGEDLGSRIAERGPLDPHDVVRLLQQVSFALERTHAAGVVHRDLKPENLFVTRRDDGSESIKVLDFGIAKMQCFDRSRPDTTLTMGTPLYMAPEQVRGDGDIGAAADIYALGQIAFTLLSGEPYWAKEKGAHNSVYPLLMRVADGVREPASARAKQLPPAFDDVFARATATAPSERYPTAGALVEALADALGETGALVVEDRGRDSSPAPRDTRRRAGLPRWSWLGAGALALVALWAASRLSFGDAIEHGGGAAPVEDASVTTAAKAHEVAGENAPARDDDDPGAALSIPLPSPIPSGGSSAATHGPARPQPKEAPRTPAIAPSASASASAPQPAPSSADPSDQYRPRAPSPPGAP
jgi:serine/threonine-protein kinase